ncbi:MAG: hypothetical protein IJ097_03515 [Bacilli bacterium]|nr:hypothetical protein [Bacilli bacterium]
MKTNDEEKIDKQIQSIKDIENKMKKKKDSQEIIIDKKYKYDDISDGDTIKIDKIEEVNEISDEKTKELEVVSGDLNTEIEEDKDNALEEKIDKNDKKKNRLPIFIITGVILLILIIILIIVLIPKKEEKKQSVSKKLSKNEQKEIIKGYGDALKGIFAVYYEKQNVMLEYNDAIKLVDYDYKVKCRVHEVYEDGSIYLNNCSINNKNTKYSYGKKQEKEEKKISDDAIKVYVSKKNGNIVLNKPNNIDDYDIYSFEIDGKYSDLTLLGNNSDYIFYTDENYNVHMINFKTGKKVLDYLNYASVLPIKTNGNYDTKYIAIKMNDKWGIYNISNNERVVSHKYDSVTPTLSMGVSGPAVEVNTLDDGVIAVVNYAKSSDSISQYGVINYRTGEEIIKQEYKQMLKSGNYIWSIDNYDGGHIFDYKGEEYLNNYNKIYWAVDGKYILVNDNDDIKVISIKGKELYNYGKLKLGNINYGISYNNGALYQFSNPNESGNNNCIELIYDSVEKKGEVKDVMCGGIAKPILYLYPKKTTKVTVSFEHPEYLQTTYPKFDGKWEVKAHSNGDLYDNNGAYYYALYWDEAKIHNVDFSEGYYVTKEDAIDFLEKKLAYIGLSRKEANEFIMYWLPILEKNEKNLVYFELTEERESYNKININPKPDSLLRLVIHIKKVDKKVEISKQNLIKFQRKGFVAVEWGGTVY